MKDRGFKVIAIAALLLAVVGLTVAYASYTETLKVSGTVTAKGSTESWDVHFTEPSSPTLGGIATVGTAPNTSATVISGFNINFFAPGDSVEYNFNVVNAGMLDAKLTAVSLGSLSCAPGNGSKNATSEEANALCADLTFKLTYADGNEIKQNDVITHTSNNTKALKLVVSWKADSQVTLSGDAVVTVGESTLTYTQA